ncbi:lipopolysaccharide biosynthesis protein [Aurantiacibacter rhizosphaerae]|uniref:Oligosaccharide flippase family protein n=1 Tax=Aurantiacibacter rhizosphaerae TaxID=2691582 RepID=A0A844XD70_9SPHN|nr:lipopolysaccharide biosynthesis protein [Aurantiacibacter rhizosphaerae]MWV27574.1 oligosaccharide flippase family protein [Aurantiacibacter rhizosphaerae]
MSDGTTSPQAGGKSVLRKRIESVLHLMTGSFGNAVIMIGSLALATRALGPEAFGVLAMTLAVGRVCERVVRFESWQPLVRYAATEEGANDPLRMSRLYLFGLILDVVGAVVAAVLSVIIAFIITSFFDFPKEMVPLVAIYAIAIALNLRGMSSAVMRMAGMFRTMAYIVFIAGILRLILAGIFYWAGAGLMTFVWVWTISQVVDALVYNFIAFRQLHKQGTPSPLRANPSGLMKDYPGFLGFAFTTNASSALRTITHEADTLIVGAFTDSSAAGFYHLAKRMAKVAMQSGEMIQMVVYPDLARMWVGQKKKQFRKTIAGVQGLLGVILAGIFLVALVIGKQLIEFAFGPDFVASYPILMAQLVAVFLIMHSAPARSALLAMNRPRFVLISAAVSTALFLGIAFYAIPIYGAIGASFAHIGFGLLNAIVLDTAMWGSSKDLPTVEKAETS